MIRVVSLRSEEGRRKTFRAHASDTTLDWEFYDAHLVPDDYLDNDQEAQRRFWGESLPAGVLGSYSTHTAIWREFLASDADNLVVLEDDVIVDWAFLEILIAQDLDAIGIPFLRLFAKVPSRFRRTATPFLHVYYHLVEHIDRPLGCQAYVMTRDGARRMLEHCRTVRRPLDVEMDRAWAHGIPNLQIMPPPAYERCGRSTIGTNWFEQRRRQLPSRRVQLEERWHRRLYLLRTRNRVLKLDLGSVSPRSHS